MEVRTKKADGTFEYGTKEEAERRLAEKQKKRMMTLCPLMNATCSADCVCYVKPKIGNTNPGSSPVWDCKGGYCNCYSLVGPD